MSAEDAIAGLATDERLLEIERADRPAFVVDSAGDVVFAGAGARALLGGAPLDPATRRTLARMAGAATGGLMRLRLGALGRLAPIAFRARPLGRDLLALEGLSPLRLRPEPPAEAPAPRDAAVGDGADAGETASPAQEPSAADSPVDPRGDIAADVEAESPPLRAGPEDEPFRFAFEIDARKRLTSLSPELAGAVGASAAAALGRPWAEIAGELGLDPDGAVAEALERRAGWGEIAVSWPVEDGRRWPFGLSALPMFDSGRTFVGFRGLGRSLGAPVPAHSIAPEEEAPDESADQAETPDPALPGPTVRAEPPAIVAMAAPSDAPFPDNVVPLRDIGPTRALSSSEESAFDEIARRLRAAGVGGAKGARREAEPASATEAPEAGCAPIRAAARSRPPGAGDLGRLVDRLPVGALILGGGEIAYANRAALELFGAKELSELAARGVDTLFAHPLPRDPDASAAALRLITGDGDEIEVEARLSAISWGGAPATLVSLRRADGSPAAQAALAREQEVAAILDVATDGVMTLDGQGRILSRNRGAETLFGFEARDVVGSLFTLSLAPESRRAAFDYLDHLKTAGVAPLSNDGREVLGLSRRGGAIPLFMTIGRLGPPEADRFCVVLRDVTPWKRAEDELVAARRQAERANAQKSEFLSKVSHEIRTPLNAIIGFAEVMMEERFGPIGSPRYKDYLRDIHASGDHLIALVGDLLDLARIESGRLKLDFAPIDLNEIAGQAAALLQPQATRGRVIIRTSLARGLPPVLADRRSVRQIMTNLASNAVKLSRPGGQVIVATALTDVGQAVFRVRDAGLGMTRQEIARAFEPFRPMTVADNDAGDELGLPLTKALAEANQAALALQSEPGQGTLAEVTFPASRVLAR